ncbi:MAG TPA: YceI family protein [Gaiellaceae bacterium]|nr:YceI family protein [Gaiellaceae bacterium]
MSTAETTIIAPVGTWNLDPVHSIVGFEVGYMVGTYKGRFHDVTASLGATEDGATLEGSAVVASVDVQNPDLSAHLQSPDFFDAERFPELRFRAEDVSLDGGRITADGEITIKGVAKSVTVTGTVSPPISDPWGMQRLGITLTATVDRTEFGLNWNNPLPTGGLALASDVTIVAELQFVQAA